MSKTIITNENWDENVIRVPVSVGNKQVGTLNIFGNPNDEREVDEAFAYAEHLPTYVIEEILAEEIAAATGRKFWMDDYCDDCGLPNGEHNLLVEH